MISVLQLGTIDYATGLRLQQELVRLRKEGRTGNILLLLEHEPVITLGRNAKSTNVLASPDQIRERGVEIYDCDRGGDVTFHGPGQIIGYPIFDLHSLAPAQGERKNLGAVEYVRRLEEVLIRTCACFGITAQRIRGLTGVWTTARAQRPEAKVAAIGVHISRGVTSHGFALNVNNDLDYFNLIIPCGIMARPVTSMAKELGKTVSREEVSQSIGSNFEAVFNDEIRWVDSLDAITSSIGVPMKPPENLRRLHEEEDTFWA